MKKQPQITDATRNAFIDAFCKLYMKTPIEKISIRELTSVAGYNRTTFYHYFEDIYGLLTYMEDSAIAHIRENIVGNITGGHIEQGFLDTFTQIYEGWEPYIKVLVANPNSARFIERLKSEMFHACLDAFRLPKDDVKAAYVLDFYLSAVLSVISRWIRNEGDISITDMGELLRSILTKGALPQIKKYSAG